MANIRAALLATSDQEHAELCEALVSAGVTALAASAVNTAAVWSRTWP
jgi:hypothetical protein